MRGPAAAAHGVIHAQERRGLTGQLEITMETMAKPESGCTGTGTGGNPGRYPEGLRLRTLGRAPHTPTHTRGSITPLRTTWNQSPIIMSKS